EEFRDLPQVRVRLAPKAGTRRSPDLVQDYDPQAKSLHTAQGVVVQLGGREFFFPVDWVANRQFSLVQSLAREVREKVLTHES
ncbi:MAG: hypothetical protein ACXWP5_03210, partial [Bdellovibrionota bacterium]